MFAALLFPIALAAPPPSSAEEGGADAPEVTIEVTGERATLPAGQSTAEVQVFTREDIEASGAQSLDELLEMVPGLDVVAGYRGPALRVRGMDPDQTLVLVDGRRAIGRVDGALDLRRFSLEEIERVEVVKGPSSALYGADALAGVVHIITRPPEGGLGWRYRGQVGSLPSTDLAVGVDGGRARAQARTDFGYQASAPVDGEGGDYTIIDGARQLHSSSELRLTPSADLVVRGQAGWTRREAAGVDLAAGGGVYDRSVGVNTLDANLGVDYIGAASRWSLLAGVSGYNDYYALDQRGSRAGDTLQRTSEQLAEVNARVEQVRGRHHWVAGVDSLGERMRSDRISKDLAYRGRAAPYVQDRVGLLAGSGEPRLALTPALRVDLDTSFGVAASPKMGMLWRVADAHLLRMSGGRGFRAPSFREQLLRFDNTGAGYQVTGNPALRPERSWSGDATWTWGSASGASLSVGGYWSELEDLIGVTTLDDGEGGPLRFSYANIESARVRGVELGGELALPGRVEASADYHLNDTLDRDTGAPLQGRAKHQGGARLGWEAPSAGLALSVGALVMGPRAYLIDDALTYSASAALLDARLSWTAPSGARVELAVDNALDAGDEHLNLQRPREITVGLTHAHRRDR